MSIQLFMKWTQAVVNSDWDSMSSLYAEDIVNLNPDGTTNEGRDACLEKDKGWDSAFSDFKFDVFNSMESGNTTVMEVQITCTMTGEMMTPDGSKSPPNRKNSYFPYYHNQPSLACYLRIPAFKNSHTFFFANSIMYRNDTILSGFTFYSLIANSDFCLS
jgi:ketosteroid isomerase-like protein